MGKLISVYQASRVLGITPQTAYEWVRRGVLTGHRDVVTGRLFVDSGEVERLVPDRRIRPFNAELRG